MPIRESEAIVLLLALVGALILFAGRRREDGVPHRGLLFTAYGFALGGWVATVVEGFIWPQTLNLLEHLFYAVHMVLLAVWCFTVFQPLRRRT